jgi:hypothetical protein
MIDEPISLRQHVEALLEAMDLRYQQRFDAQKEAINAALLAAEKAVTKAEMATDKRFDSVNEFRQTLSDQSKTFFSRVEATALSDRLAAFSDRLNKSEGRGAGLSAGWGYLIGAGGLVSAVIIMVVTLAK